MRRELLNDQLIYDVGAHKGEDTEFYLKKGFAVVAIEAVPEFCELLRRKFAKAVTDGQLKILSVAVSEATGKIDFYIHETISEWGTTNPDWVRRNKFILATNPDWGSNRTRKISVESRPLIDIMNEHGTPRYCKIDIEGNDLAALRSLIGSKGIPPYISIESETHDWNMLMKEFLILRELGYNRYKIVNQALIGLQTCPRPAREGRDCDHCFQFGCSGLFGEELPGAWLALQEAVEAYRHIFRGYALNGEYGMFSGKFSIFRKIARIQAMATHIKGFKTAASILPPADWYDTHAAR